MLLFHYLVPIALAATSGEEAGEDSSTAPRYIPPEVLSMFPQHWVDLVGRPCPVRDTDYATILASEMLSPDRVTIDGKLVVRVGMPESTTVKHLGREFRQIEPPILRDKDESNLYISDLMQQNRRTMHYYILQGLKGMEGWFKVMEWDCCDSGSIRVYFAAGAENGVYSAKLVHMRFREIPASQVTLRSGSKLIAERSGPPHVIWDISRNALTLTNH